MLTILPSTYVSVNDQASIVRNLVLELDFSHVEEEGSGHVPVIL